MGGGGGRGGEGEGRKRKFTLVQTAYVCIHPAVTVYNNIVVTAAFTIILFHFTHIHAANYDVRYSGLQVSWLTK